MGNVIESGYHEPVIPCTLTIYVQGVGPIADQSPTVAVRILSSGLILDFNDYVFKSSGWVTPAQTMIESSYFPGRYYAAVDVPSLPTDIGEETLALEYVNGGIDAPGIDQDIVLFRDAAWNARIVRQSVTNRMEEVSGNPGTIKLYGDDATTVLMTQTLTDETGGRVTTSVGEPARRSQGT